MLMLSKIRVVFVRPNRTNEEDDKTRLDVVYVSGNDTDCTSVAIHDGIGVNHMTMSFTRPGRPTDDVTCPGIFRPSEIRDDEQQTRGCVFLCSGV